MKTIFLPVAFTFLLFSCGSTNETEKSKEQKKDSVTDEADLPIIEEVEMDYVYEVTNTKTKKTIQMSQEEYLQSAIWENPDCVIKEIPVVR